MTSVPFRSLGKDGPRVPAMGFGLMSLSYHTYGAIPTDEERFAVLDRAFEIGATFWDTAEYVKPLTDMPETKQLTSQPLW